MKTTGILFSLALMTLAGPGYAQTADPTAPALSHAPQAARVGTKSPEAARDWANYDRQWQEEQKRVDRVMNICTGC